MSHFERKGGLKPAPNKCTRRPSAASLCAPFACGVNAAVRDWGVALRGYKGKDQGFPAGGFDNDPTLAYLGYYSDNGAFYYYYTHPHEDYGAVFRELKAVEVEQRRIPLRYLQLDSYWYFKGPVQPQNPRPTLCGAHS